MCLYSFTPLSLCLTYPKDTLAPTLVGVPVSVTVSCNQIPSVPSVNASDTCSGIVPVQYSERKTHQSCSFSYQLQRTWSATDACGNAATAAQTITVQVCAWVNVCVLLFVYVGVGVGVGVGVSGWMWRGASGA